jgi:hypothetical protein
MDTITIAVPEHLQTSAIPLHRWESVPIDIRAQISSALGHFDLIDGRIYVAETDADYDIELEVSKTKMDVKGVRRKISVPLNVVITPCTEAVVKERVNARRLLREKALNAALRRVGG